MPTTKEKKHNIEFIRAVCALGILIYHFSEHASSPLNFMKMYANGNISGALIDVFLIISGSMLYLNNSEISSLKEFYYKRFKSVYPSFYIAFGCFFLYYVIRFKKFFYLDCSPFTLLLSVLGVDGYFMSYTPNYYILGEWFLGAIIILYLIYPILLYGIRKYPVATTVFVLSAYASIIFYNVFQTSLKNIFSCMMSFYVGMLLQKHEKLIKNRLVFAISAVICILLALYRLPFISNPENVSFKNVMNHLMGLLLFITLYHIGDFITRLGFIRKIFDFLGSLSYPVFLLHHQVILIAVGIYNPTAKVDYFVTLTAVISVTLVLSLALKTVTKLLLKSQPYKDFEALILKKHTNR